MINYGFARFFATVVVVVVVVIVNCHSGSNPSHQMAAVYSRAANGIQMCAFCILLWQKRELMRVEMRSHKTTTTTTRTVGSHRSIGPFEP